MRRLLITGTVFLLAACVGPSPEAASHYQPLVRHARCVEFSLPPNRDLKASVAAWAEAEGISLQTTGATPTERWQADDVDIELVDAAGRLGLVFRPISDSSAAESVSTRVLEAQAGSLARFLEREEMKP